jgi:hypothetical protein
MNDFESSTRQVFKAMNHVMFLKENEINKRKRKK